MRVPKTSHKNRAGLLASAALGLLAPTLLLSPAPAAAQSEAKRSYDIPAQPLADALTAFGQQSTIQFSVDGATLVGKTSGTVKGNFTPAEALARLLSGTGLTFRMTGASTVAIEPAMDGAVDGERVLGAVRVEGAKSISSALAGASPVNGINGSRDVTATEGTGSYTSNALTIGSKTAATIKDTPMSVSVLTSQQMQDQNITDLNSAMRNLPGVSLVNTTGSQYSFYSRGFQIKQFQFDGGAPMKAAGTQAGYNPLIDLSLYDHVEIVRGAAGTFTGYGDPGGVINLVRKKPLDHTQLLAELQVGSWDWYRGMVDLTGPLAFDGKLRGRVIATHQDNRYFYDIAKASRNVLSATLELDASPTTLVSFGANYQDSDDLPNRYGLMRYRDGRSLNLPRSSCFCFNYASDKTKNTEFFGQVEQRIGNDWTAKFKITRIRQARDTISPYVFGTVNPYTFVGPNAGTDAFAYVRHKQTMLEGTVDGHFRLFGQDQKIIVGANYSMINASGSKFGYNYYFDSQGNYVQIGFPGRSSNAVDVFNFNPNDWLEPNFPDGYWREVINSDERTLNAYLNLDLTPFKRFHIATGVRYAGYRRSSLYKDACEPGNVQNNQYGCTVVGQIVYTGAGELYKGSDISWPPSVQARYDITDNLTASAIYTDIYVDQSYYLDKDDKPLPPITGGNFEGMLKWLSPDKKLNVTLSGYYIRQNGFAATDPICIVSAGNPAADARCTNASSTTAAGELNQPTFCCYVFNADQKNISYGSELEVTGEIRKGWQISASYSYNRSYRNYQTDFNGEPTSLVSYAPRHKFQLWTTYSFDDASRLPGLTLGLGLQAQSSTFVVSSYCKAFVPASINPARPCEPGQSVPVDFTEPGRIVLSGSVGYRLNDHLRVDVEMENLLDKTYYETVGALTYGNFYGAPRNAKVTLRGKF